MGITHYESQEALDESFEDMMEKQNEIAYLREEILMQESCIAQCKDELADAENGLKDLYSQLNELIEETEQ